MDGNGKILYPNGQVVEGRWQNGRNLSMEHVKNDPNAYNEAPYMKQTGSEENVNFEDAREDHEQQRESNIINEVFDNHNDSEVG